MDDDIAEPVELVDITWLPGPRGRRPTVPVYRTNCVFRPSGDEEQPRPGEPMLTVFVQIVDTLPDGRDVAFVRFPATDLAAPHVRVGNGVVIMNGPRVVADAMITETL